MPVEEIAFTVRPKINPNPKFLGTAEAYFVCHIGPQFFRYLLFMPSLGVRSPWIDRYVLLALTQKFLTTLPFLICVRKTSGKVTEQIQLKNYLSR